MLLQIYNIELLKVFNNIKQNLNVEYHSNQHRQGTSAAGSTKVLQSSLEIHLTHIYAS